MGELRTSLLVLPGPHYSRTRSSGAAAWPHPGPSQLPFPLPPPPLPPFTPPCIFQVILIQPQAQSQPEGTAGSRSPTQEPSQGAQAAKKKQDQPPSQENPEVGRLRSGDCLRGWGRASCGVGSQEQAQTPCGGRSEWGLAHGPWSQPTWSTNWTLVVGAVPGNGSAARPPGVRPGVSRVSGLSGRVGPCPICNMGDGSFPPGTVVRGCLPSP